MNNFYLGFKGNVFSKMFMMFAVFMAMSSSLCGGELSFKAETVDGDSGSNGYLDYVRITPLEKVSDSVYTQVSVKITGSTGLLFYETTVDSSNNFVNIFDGTLYNGTTNNGVTTFSVLNAADKNSINEFYIKLKSSYSSVYMTNHTFTIKRSDTSTSYITKATTTNKFPTTDINSMDGANPVLMRVVANSNHGFEDNITLTFSEPIQKVGTPTIADKIADGNLSFSETSGKIFDYNVSLVLNTGSAPNIMIFKINDGIKRENFIGSSISNIFAHIGANTLSDRSGHSNNVNVTAKTSDTITTEDRTGPSITEIPKFDLNDSFEVVVTVDELLKNTDDIHFKVQLVDGSSAINGIQNPLSLTGDITYNNDKNLTTTLSRIDIISLKKLLTTTSATSIKVGIVSGTTATDAVGNNIQTSSVAIINGYIKDDSNATVESIEYLPTNQMQINFSDAIKTSPTNILSYLDINYTATSAPSYTTDSATRANDGKSIVITFSDNLTEGQDLTIQTTNGYNVAYTETSSQVYKIENYTNLPLEPFLETRAITEPPTIYTYKPFKLDLNNSKIVLYFDDNAIADGNKISLASSTNLVNDDFNISQGGTYEKLVPNDISAVETDDQNVTISLSSTGLNKLRLYVGNKKQEDINLSVAKLTRIIDKFSRSPEHNHRITTGEYVKDATDPEVLSWALDLDASSPNIKITFNIPVDVNFSKISGKLVIASTATTQMMTSIENNTSDQFGYFKIIDINNTATTGDYTTASLDSTKEILTFDLNDSFVQGILNDRNLATSSGTNGNAFLVIRNNNGILNINQEVDNNLSESNSTNLPEALTTLTASNGNVNVLFTANRGVNVFNDYNTSDNLTPNKWYMMTIPWGIDISAEELKATNHFDTIWKYAPTTPSGTISSTSGWSQPTGYLNNSTGYWIKTENYTDINWKVSMKFDINTSRPNESIDEFKARVKVTDRNYRLIGLNNDVSMGMIKKHSDYSHFGNAYQVCVHYFNAKSGAWDDKLNLKAGNALWIKQGCTKTYTNSSTSTLD